MAKISNSRWLLILLICCGMVFGSLLGSLAEQVSWLAWLNYGLDFGMTSPFVFDIQILVITFAIKIKITIASMIGMLIAVLIYRHV